MESRKFKEANLAIAENQEEYETLHAHHIEGDSLGTVIFSFKLNKEEIKQVVETGTIYLTQLSFNKAITPIGPSLLNPFLKEY